MNDEANTTTFEEPWTLEELVKLKDEIILSEDDNYVAIAKPADLRMDGSCSVTVQKLMLSWYPTPILLERLQSDINYIEQLSKWSDLPDNILRPCHQLDYATSGVLLFAKTKAAAAAAGKSFCERYTHKFYTAVVHGHLNIENLQIFSQDVLDSWNDGSIEGSYKRRRRLEWKATKKGDRGGGVINYLPIHSVFEAWKGKLRSLAKNSDRSDVGKDHIFKTCALNVLEEAEKEKLLKMKWGQVKEIGLYRRLFEELSEKVNAQRLVEKSASSSGSQKKRLGSGKKLIEKSITNLPVPSLFRIRASSEGIAVLRNETFYVQCKIASLSDRFRMCFDVDQVNLNRESMKYYTSLFKDIDKSELDFKPSLTECRILNRGYLNGRCVTKLLLKPKTGRRHQIRVHMAITGHPIVGDASYEVPHQRAELMCNRMCLHAKSLTIPLLQDEASSFEAPDPFPDDTKKIIKIVGGKR